jgi:hypothetical protein
MYRNQITYTYPIDRDGRTREETAVVRRRYPLTHRGAERVMRKGHDDRLLVVVRVEPMVEE